MRGKEVASRWPSTWPNLRELLGPINTRITSLDVGPAMDGHKAVIRFMNDYGVEIFEYPGGDFFEMAVIKFPGQESRHYEFACDIDNSDLSLGYAAEDIYRLCEQVSRLK
jgi:hypothetical protein